jgi:tetratricopeptide (TPR) repeat protein
MRHGVWIVVGVLGAATAAVRADVVSAQGRPLAVDVKILAVKDGQLRYQSDAGAIERPLEQIRYLQVLGWDAFNQAEKQQRDGKAATAIAGYEKILEGGAAGGEGELNRELLVRCRLMRLYDAEGEFEAAVGMYLAVATAMPTAAEALRPTRVPKDAAVLGRAAKLVEAAVAKRDYADPLAMSLEKWRSSWPDMDHTSGRTTTRPSGPNTPPLVRGGEGTAARGTTASNGMSTPAGAELGGLVEAGKFDEALKRAAATMKAATGALPPEVCYWQGRAYLGLAGRAQEKEAQTQRRRAGLAFMRVAIGSPGGPLAAECLYRAGEICREEGRPERAAVLWTELTTTYPTAAPWAKQAREALAKIKTTAK